MQISEKIQNWFFQLLIDKPHTWQGIFAAFFLSILFLLAVHSMIKTDFNYEWLTYTVILFCVAGVWLVYKYKYPKNNKKQTGIVIALHAKDGEALKLKNTFISELEKNINSASLNDVFNIIRLKNHHAENIKSKNDLESINKKINGHLYLYGDIRKEPDGETDKYFINLEGYVAHQPIPIPTSQELSMDFRNVLPKELNFPDFFGYRCIKATGKIAYLATKYIVGVASFLSENPFLAYRLHHDLEGEFVEYKKINDEMKGKAEISKLDAKYLKQLRKKLSFIISNETLILSKIFFRNNRMADCAKYLKIAEEKNPNNYGVHLLKAIFSFTVQNDVVAATKSIKKAEKLANGTHEWRYSNAFLLFWNGKFQEAFTECQKISRATYSNEQNTVNEVEDFNLKILSERTDKAQLYFWLGYIILKKRNDSVLATDYFKKFLSSSNNSIPLLAKKAESFLAGINQ